MINFDLVPFGSIRGMDIEKLWDVIGIFNNVENVWLAGGAIRRTLLGQSLDSDFDFFFRSEQALNEWEKVAFKNGFEVVRKTGFHTEYKNKDGIILQAIAFNYFNEVEVLLKSFDFTICQFAIKVSDCKVSKLVVYCTEDALFDTARKRLMVNNITYPVASMRRLLKYTNQGFYACTGTMVTFLNQCANIPINDDTFYLD